MLLSARLLNDLADVNTFDVVTVLESVAGDQLPFFFQTVDASAEKLANPPGRRYVAAVGATLKVVLQSLNSAQTISAYCTRPFAGDQSIWKFVWPIPPFPNTYDPTKTLGTFALKMTLVEPGTTMPAAWAIATNYAADNLVSYLGGLFRSLQANNLGNTPTGGNTDVWWVQMNIVQPRTFSGFYSQALSIASASPEF